MLAAQQLELYVGGYQDSVVLKIYKKHWTSDKANPLTAKTRIFFTIWLSEKTLQQNRLYYNIHAFKLRELEGYSIASREFAKRFRAAFKQHESEWENVSVDFGPLTLMEGWHDLEAGEIENTIINLATNFINRTSLIDKTLKTFED